MIYKDFDIKFNEDNIIFFVNIILLYFIRIFVIIIFLELFPNRLYYWK